MSFIPYEWQLNDLSTLKKNQYTGLLNIDPGGTKTAISSLAIKDSGAETVLICAPKSTFQTAWRPTIEAVTGREARMIGNGNKQEKVAYTDFELGYPGVYLSTPQFLVRSDVSTWSGEMLILDEALSLDTPIPTPHGWATVGELSVGDNVLSPRGREVRVKRLTQIRQGRTFRISTDRGFELVADAGHKWIAAPRVKGGSFYLKPRMVTTEEMFQKKDISWRIEPTQPIELPEKSLPVDPYVLGQWLGNGTRGQPHLTVRRHLLDKTLTELLSRGYDAYPLPKNNRPDIVRISLGKRFSRETREAGFFRSKYLPTEYLRGSKDQRIDILRGLMDSDGYVNGSGFTFTNTNLSLLFGLSEIARTLGFVVSKPKKVQDNKFTVKECYRVYFSGSNLINPFLLRGESYRPPGRGPISHRIVSIEETDSVLVRCIEVDSEDHLFLAGEAMIPTHNCHKVATPRSKAQRKISGFSPRDDGEPLSKRFGARLALSGTPARQNFENMWSTMRFLWPELDGKGQVADSNFWAWLRDRMTYEEIVTGFEWVPVSKKPIPNGFTGYKKKINGVLHWGETSKAKKWLTEAQPGRLLREAPCVLTHYRRQECCPWHPNGFLSLEEPQILERVVELDTKQKKAIRELETHYMTFLGEHPLVTELTITQQQRIRQICLGVPTIVLGENGESSVEFDKDCVSPFIDETLDILSSLPDDEPVLIFLDSQRFATIVTDRLNKAGVAAAEYSGKTVTVRDKYLEKFGVDYRVLVGVTSAIGTGTDSLQHKSSTEVWLEIPVSLTNRLQAESRLDRVGARRQVQRYVVKDSEGYAEGRMSAQLDMQLKLNASLRGGSNG